MTRTFKRLITVLVVFVFSCTFIVQSALAQPPPKVNMYIHTDPNTAVGSAYPNSYNEFSEIPGVEVIHSNIVGWSYDQFRAQLQKDFASPGASNMVMYGGHGVIGGLGTDGGLNFNRSQALTAIGQAAASNGTSASVFVESCGSGIVCNLGTLPDGLNAVYTASTAKLPGWVYKAGGSPWLAEFGEDVKKAIKHFGDGSPEDPDKNKDGVITTGELDKALNKSDGSRVDKPDEPLFFRDAETAE